MESNDKKNKNIIQSFKCAFQGLYSAIKTSRNVKIDIVCIIILIIFGFIFKINIYEWMISILCIGLVLALEIMNSALEDCVDLAEPYKHPIAKRSKDMAAASVLFASIIALIIAYIIFIPKILEVL